MIKITSYILYSLCFFLLFLSFIKDKDKTKLALKKSFISFEGIMPQFLAIVFIVGFILSLVNTEIISKLIGHNSGIFGVVISAIIGSITVMPTFVSFSIGNSLLNSGAGYPQVAALISSLTMVGFMTIALESKYLGKKLALIRNILAFIFSFIVAFFMGVIF